MIKQATTSALLLSAILLAGAGCVTDLSTSDSTDPAVAGGKEDRMLPICPVPEPVRLTRDPIPNSPRIQAVLTSWEVALTATRTCG